MDTQDQDHNEGLKERKRAPFTTLPPNNRREGFHEQLTSRGAIKKQAGDERSLATAHVLPDYPLLSAGKIYDRFIWDLLCQIE